MVLICSTTPHDTDELIALRRVINDNERAFSEIRTIYSVDQRRLCDEHDALMAAQRPIYPTPEHLQGLDMVAGLQFMHDAVAALFQTALQQLQFVQFLYGKGQPAADVCIHGGFGGGIHRAVQ